MIIEKNNSPTCLDSTFSVTGSSTNPLGSIVGSAVRDKLLLFLKT